MHTEALLGVIDCIQAILSTVWRLTHANVLTRRQMVKSSTTLWYI